MHSHASTMELLMIRSIAAALAAFVFVAFGARAEEAKKEEPKAEAKAEKKAEKAEKKAEKKAEEKKEEKK